jgi:signal transduction histidine kinase
MNWDILQQGIAQAVVICHNEEDCPSTMSISSKFTMLVTVLVALILGAAGYVRYRVERGERARDARSVSDGLAQVLKVSAESVLPDHGRLGQLSDLVERHNRAGRAVVFYGTDARALAPAPSEEDPVEYPPVRRVMERNAGEQEWLDQADTAIYLVRLPLVRGDKVAGGLELRTDVGAMLDVHWSALGLIVSGGLLLSVALAVGVYARRSIRRPIVQLMDGMDHVIKGDLSHTLPMDRTDEIGHIAFRFNEMTAQLRAAQEEIRQNGQARLQLEQRLGQSEKLATIGQLSAEIAHEVGTPLNVIGGRARELSKKARDASQVEKNSRIIAEQAERITKIIQQLLNLARAPVRRRARVDVGALIQDTLVFLDGQLSAAKITVKTQLIDLSPRPWGDADGLQQVLLNILLNAIQAMESGGLLTIAMRTEERRKSGLDLSPPEEYLAIIISDTGPGIPLELRQRVFEPFFSTKGRGEGTGLGLTVAFGIINEHDGWIEVDQATPQGATFRIFLPTSGAGDLGQETPAASGGGVH